jgi:hypothetical protein
VSRFSIHCILSVRINCSSADVFFENRILSYGEMREVADRDWFRSARNDNDQRKADRNLILVWFCTFSAHCVQSS